MANRRRKSRAPNAPAARSPHQTTGSSTLTRVVKVCGVGATAFGIVTSAFWVFLSFGSWRDEERSHPINNGCLEFDLRTSIKGVLYAPNPGVVTKYSEGYVLGNWVGLDFETSRDGKTQERGTAFAWINPFSRTLTLHYKIQAFGGTPFGGHREEKGLRFKWNQEPCPAM